MIWTAFLVLCVLFVWIENIIYIFIGIGDIIVVVTYKVLAYSSKSVVQ